MVTISSGARKASLVAAIAAAQAELRTLQSTLATIDAVTHHKALMVLGRDLQASKINRVAFFRALAAMENNRSIKRRT